MTRSIQPEVPQPTPPSLTGKIARVIAWTAASIGLILVLLFAAIALYSTTADFQRRVTAQVAQVLEDATGGKVQVAHISFDIWHLAIQVDSLVIHGLEAPTEAPYLAADRIQIRLKIVSFFALITSATPASHVGLDLLRVESPRVHLIIDKDGKTNQPVPKHQTQSNRPIADTLLDLKAHQVELVQGLALLNDRAIPFNLAARDLAAQIHYLPATDRYGATIDLRNLQTQIAKQPQVDSSLHLEVELGRDAADLKAFDFRSGDRSQLKASATVNHFQAPLWQANLLGSLDLHQLTLLANLQGFDRGVIDLNLGGHNCALTPVVAQRQPRLWERLRSKREAQSTAPKTLPPDPQCEKGYLLLGDFKLHNASYRNDYVRFHDINGGAQLKITPTQLLFTALSGYLPGGGDFIGELKIDNWLGEVPANTPATSATIKGATQTANATNAIVTGKKGTAAPPSAPAVSATHAYLTAKTNRIPLRTILDTTAPLHYPDLGFDTAISGPIKVEWGGAVVDVSQTVIADADFTLVPTGARRKGTLNNTPLTGKLLGHYDGRTRTVAISRFNVNSLDSTINANGTVGFAAGDPLTALNVDLDVRNFAEYDQLLYSLQLQGSNGRRGASAIPVNLHGSAHFAGTARGEIAKLDVKGHLEANNLEVRLGDLSTLPDGRIAPPTPPDGPSRWTSAPNAPPSAPLTDVHIDTLVAEAEYTPQGLAVGSSTITQGTAVLHLAGSFKPHPVIIHRQTQYVWGDQTALDASVQLANSHVVDLLTIAGQQNTIPVTGTVVADAHLTGTFASLDGSGKIALANGIAYGEPYEAIDLTASASGQDLEAPTIALRLHGMSLTGNAGYNLTSKHLHAHLQGNDLRLSKFVLIQKQNLGADGVIALNADADGTLDQPNLRANARFASITAKINGVIQPIGDATLEAHSQASDVFYTLNSTLIGTQVSASGQTNLTGDYQTNATLKIAAFDIARPLALFQPAGFNGKPVGTSNIAGTVILSGPARTPTALTGRAQFSAFEITSQGITLKAAEPLTIGLRNGLATLDQVHIVGIDTDMHASGTAQLFGVPIPPNAKVAPSGALNIKTDGSVSMALAHTFDPDLISSGKVLFTVGIGGTLAAPVPSGRLQFQNVNLAIEDVPNGLSNVNGSLLFNQDRLNVESLVATTGGGQIKIGGFLTYRNGFYADLTATGDVVRIRYEGISSTANANLHLQGSPQSSLLSGNILLTRFGVGADVDFAAFAAAGGVQAPPDPASAANKIRLDVHITSSPQLDFQNSYAKLAGTVDLTIRGTVEEPSILGRIQITDGSATFASTKYQLQRGDIYFTNPVRIDPVIDLDATTRVETYDVTIGLHGTATNLKPTYRSEPPLSEADIFALLAQGRTQEEAQIYQEQQVQSGTDPTTNALLSGALNATVSNRVSKLFGVGSVKIDPSYVGSLGNSSARITVQQQLSRQLTVTYATNVNSSAQQLIQVQYDLSPTMSIVAARDETGVFSVVYKIRRAYK